MKDNSEILMRNIGFDSSFFSNSIHDVFVIKKSSVKKIFSEGAIHKISSDPSALQQRKSAEAEDLSIYADSEFDREEEQKGFGGNFISGETNLFDDDEQHEAPLKVFKNCSSEQMNRLSTIITSLNSTEQEKLAVKAYRSKLKSKFYSIYEKNSKWLKEKNKHKIFHRCNYPRCNRTFASSGWLRAHFNSHLEEIRKEKFSTLFDQVAEKMKSQSLGFRDSQ